MATFIWARQCIHVLYTCLANVPLAVGGDAAGSMVDDPTVSAGSEAEALVGILVAPSLELL